MPIWGQRWETGVSADGYGTCSVYPVSLTAESEYDADDKWEATDNWSQDQAGARGLFISRLVGSIFLSRNQATTGNNEPQTAIVAAGLFVAPQSGENEVVPAGVAISTFDTSDAAGAAMWRQYSPLAAQAQNQPWMWRRTWVLSNNGLQNNNDFAYPSCNAYYGSLREGTNVDIKSKRFIPPGTSLYVILATVPMEFEGGEGASDGIIQCFLNLRAYGNLTSSRRKGGNFAP